MLGLANSPELNYHNTPPEYWLERAALWNISKWMQYSLQPSPRWWWNLGGNSGQRWIVRWLDLMILEGFSNINGSMTLCASLRTVQATNSQEEFDGFKTRPKNTASLHEEAKISVNEAWFSQPTACPSKSQRHQNPESNERARDLLHLFQKLKSKVSEWVDNWTHPRELLWRIRMRSNWQEGREGEQKRKNMGGKGVTVLVKARSVIGPL